MQNAAAQMHQSQRDERMRRTDAGIPSCRGIPAAFASEIMSLVRLVGTHRITSTKTQRFPTLPFDTAPIFKSR